jgi:glycolate oxidase iron-sulfur subunit
MASQLLPASLGRLQTMRDHWQRAGRRCYNRRDLRKRAVAVMNSKSLPVIQGTASAEGAGGAGGDVKVDLETYTKFGACVHCGLCLPACPTYVETMDEADSPRGRIHLMKAVVDGKVRASPIVFEHLDRCLVCRACETACPSGVQYHDLIEAVRPQVAEAVLGKGKRMKSGMLQWMVGHVLPHAGRASAAMKPLGVLKAVGLGGLVERMAPGALAVAESSKRADRAGRAEIEAFTPARGKHRGSVVLLRGCVGSVVSGDVNAACVKVLTENGLDVHLLSDEPCCGAMAAHANDPEGARVFARRMVERLEKKGGDYFVSPIAGCGAQLKSLHHVLAGEGPWEDRARAAVRKMRDISELLMEIGIAPPAGRLERIVTYHDPCHLIHAQRISDAPRQLLALVPGLRIQKLPESDMCCGAAGTYSMNQPAMAARLGQRKVAHILETGAQELITANIGCALQIARHLRERGSTVRVRHVVELMAEAYGKTPHADRQRTGA